MNKFACLCLALLLSLVTACSGSGGGGSKSDVADPAALTINVDDGAVDVDVATLASVEVEHGTLDEVTLTAGDGSTISGEIADGVWTASARLEPATSYILVAKATGDDGKSVEETRAFTAMAVAEDQQIYPSVAPLAGETVGVGMPVVVLFDHPVTDRAAFEQHMHVASTPEQNGSWYWLSDSEAHWRPEVYWQAGTTVQVQLDLNSVPAGDGRYGQESRTIDFSVGSANIYTVDIAGHTMTVERDGQLVKTLPVTTGDSTHQTRVGTKIIMEKSPSVDMDAATTGVDSEDPGYYRVEGVKWAMRLTNSGEFIHAAPWSVASQGNANVSHGCTGMSTENAGWLYGQALRGDVVTFINGTRQLEAHNGWTDWNVSWEEYQKGSALYEAAPAA
ncbi:MAG: Ig-like domain-containing protein [Aeromicrobium sp.]|uniref:L,D-transpeptidase n=1 Tax=Aeromicrobium sp. TaxID=1871063 RepID=UPI0039E718B1